MTPPSSLLKAFNHKNFCTGGGVTVVVVTVVVVTVVVVTVVVVVVTVCRIWSSDSKRFSRLFNESENHRRPKSSRRTRPRGWKKKQPIKYFSGPLTD